MRLNSNGQLDILGTARRQLAIDLNCEAGDLAGQGIIIREFRANPGRRPFPVGDTCFNMVHMGGAVVVSASARLLPYLRGALEGKTRDDAFSMPFVHGHSLYFLPSNALVPLMVPDGVMHIWFERGDMPALYAQTAPMAWHNAISYDMDHARPDILAVMAVIGGRPAGLAGASADCEGMWQIGIDVAPEHRRAGLASALVSMLAAEILSRGKVPYYGTSSSNIASMRTACRAGFTPAWVSAWKGIFDGVPTEANG